VRNKLSGSKLALGGGGDGLWVLWLAGGSLLKLREAGWLGGGIVASVFWMDFVFNTYGCWEIGALAGSVETVRAATGAGVTEFPR